MKFAADPAPGGAVQGFRGRGFRVGGIDYAGGVIASAAGAADWAADTLAALIPADFDALPPAELLLIGTGATMARPPAALLAALTPRLAVEYMDSRAAARTYNLLLGEGRRVAVALLPL